MPVRKYRSVADVPPPWREAGDPDLARAIERVWDFGQRWIQPRFPPGLYKCRTMEEMNRLDEQWAAENFEAFRARRRTED